MDWLTVFSKAFAVYSFAIESAVILLFNDVRVEIAGFCFYFCVMNWLVIADQLDAFLMAMSIATTFLLMDWARLRPAQSLEDVEGDIFGRNNLPR